MMGSKLIYVSESGQRWSLMNGKYYTWPVKTRPENEAICVPLVHFPGYIPGLCLVCYNRLDGEFQLHATQLAFFKSITLYKPFIDISYIVLEIKSNYVVSSRSKIDNLLSSAKNKAHIRSVLSSQLSADEVIIILGELGPWHGC